MSTFKLPDWWEPAAWGLVVGAVVTCWSALSLFGWVSAGTAAQMVAQAKQEAVVAYATPACVARFTRQPNARSAWEALNKTEVWDRRAVVVEGGWSAEPGQKLPVELANAISAKCVEQLLALKTLGGVKLNKK
ncbi:hypothetical protein HY415_02900 [Candidatus Kaiserbacteria bacterium]|nr:hypothetical protein [Candidatus Kaiserbacteria bacterium]